MPRTKSSELIKQLDSQLIKIVIGPRRSGKSRLIQKTLEDKKAVYINFEDDVICKVPGEHLIDTAKQIYEDAEYWYLDEIQNYPQWETLVNKLYRRGQNLLVTGSNAKLLSSELASTLTGRHIPIELLPFSYSEYCDAVQRPPSWDSFSTYQLHGGLPEVVLGGARDPNGYLSALFDSIVLRDLVQRKKIRHPGHLSNILSLLMNNIASRTSARALSAALDGSPSPTTTEKYLGMASEAYLIETIGPYASKTKDRLQGERKPFSIDTGFLAVKTQPLLSNTDKLLKNAVYLELRRRGYAPRQSLFYGRSKDGREVDFIVRHGHQTTQLIQVCLTMKNLETREREIRALASAAKDYPNAAQYIVTADESAKLILPDSKREIIMMPVWEFCSSVPWSGS